MGGCQQQFSDHPVTRAHKHNIQTLNYLENMLWAPALYPGMIIWHILTQTQRRTHKVRMTQFHLASLTVLRGFENSQNALSSWPTRLQHVMVSRIKTHTQTRTFFDATLYPDRMYLQLETI